MYIKSKEKKTQHNVNYGSLESHSIYPNAGVGHTVAGLKEG